MRIDWDFGHPLKEQVLPRYLQKMVAEESRAQREREEEAERRRFKVDLSKLGGIRSAAAVTREALLVDEEREGYVPGDAAVEPKEAPETPRAVAVAAPAPTPADEPTSKAASPDLGLTDQESALLTALLDHREAEVPAGTSVDMLVDSINDKLFDLVGDTVLEFGDAGPAIVEDYEQDLRGYLQP